ENDLSGLLMQGMPRWNDILKSTDALVVQRQYSEWLKVEGLARAYISSIAIALKIYLEYYLQIEFDRSQSDEDFVYINQVWMNKVPYLTEHSANAYLVANYLMTFQPGLKAMQLAGLVASKIAFGQDLFKPGALEKMKKELVDNGITLPAIVETL
ncbi:MAG TPA: hypothetical protein VFW22_05780, partial [Pseudolabrys sp.]|nr:hypothetical protein [Pseudolabrys sp.]